MGLDEPVRHHGTGHISHNGEKQTHPQRIKACEEAKHAKRDAAVMPPGRTDRWGGCLQVCRDQNPSGSSFCEDQRERDEVHSIRKLTAIGRAYGVFKEQMNPNTQTTCTPF